MATVLSPLLPEPSGRPLPCDRAADTVTATMKAIISRKTTAKASRSHRVRRPACAGGRRSIPPMSMTFPRMTNTPRSANKNRPGSALSDYGLASGRQARARCDVPRRTESRSEDRPPASLAFTEIARQRQAHNGCRLPAAFLAGNLANSAHYSFWRYLRALPPGHGSGSPSSGSSTGQRWRAVRWAARTALSPGNMLLIRAVIRMYGVTFGAY
jgi:hypothetical protein